MTGFSETLIFVYIMRSKEAQSPTLSFNSKPPTLLGAKDDFRIYITPKYLIQSRTEVLKKKKKNRVPASYLCASQLSVSQSVKWSH